MMGKYYAVHEKNKRYYTYIFAYAREKFGNFSDIYIKCQVGYTVSK